MSGIAWTDWCPEAFIDHIRGRLTERMEVVCKFVELDAKKRLIAMEYPRYGKPYRRRILSPKVTYMVTVKPRVVEGRVGLREWYRRGKEMSYGGYYIEMGSRNFPPHPWLRPAVFNNLRTIAETLKGGF